MVEQVLRDQQAPYGLPDDPARAKYPRVFELMSEHYTRNGRAKQACSMSVNGVPGAWAVSLRDMTLSVMLPAESESLEGCLQALEDELARPRPRWRQLRHGERAQRLKSEDAKLPAPWEPGKRRS